MNSKIAVSFAFVLMSFVSNSDLEPGRVQKSTQGSGNVPYLQKTNTLSKAVTFHASFNNGPDADFGAGDKRIYTGDFKGSREQDDLPKTQGSGTPPLSISKGKGKHGAALEFTKDNSHVVFYKLEKNIEYREKEFTGSASFWMSLDPGEIPNQYCDPLQITDKYYASDAIWVDITKNDVPPDFRVGVLGDEKVWDVNKKQGGGEEFFWHLLKISEPPFRKDKWTHVVITWQLNGSDIGRAKLYFDGEYRGQSGPIREPLRWNISKVTMRLGTGHYVGLMDDIALFNRALTTDEVKALYNLKEGVRELYP